MLSTQNIILAVSRQVERPDRQQELLFLAHITCACMHWDEYYNYRILCGTTLKDLSQHDYVNNYMQYLHSKVKSTPCRLQRPLTIYHKHTNTTSSNTLHTTLPSCNHNAAVVYTCTHAPSSLTGVCVLPLASCSEHPDLYSVCDAGRQSLLGDGAVSNRDVPYHLQLSQGC